MENWIRQSGAVESTLVGGGGGVWETGWRYIWELSQEVRLEVRWLQGGRRHLGACVSRDKRVDDLKAKQDLNLPALSLSYLAYMMRLLAVFVGYRSCDLHHRIPSFHFHSSNHLLDIFPLVS